jgi:hypothetical protein
MDGGDIEERTEKILRELGGDVGLSFALGTAKIELGGKGRRTIEEEIKRKRTAHSAIGELLERLRETDVLVSLDGYEHLRPDENDVVEFSGNIEIWPPGPWPIERQPSGFPWRRRSEDPSIARRRELGLPRRFTARLPMGRTGLMAIMPMIWQYVVAQDTGELTRRVTVVGQVEVVPADEERLAAAFLAVDRSCGVVVAEAKSDYAIKDLLAFVPAYKGKWTMVRPLCIYK